MDSRLILITLLIKLGAAAAIASALAGSHEDVWSFSPFIDLGLYSWLRKALRRPRVDWQISFLFVVLAFRFPQVALPRAFPHWLFCPRSDLWTMQLAVYATTAACVG